MSAVTAARRARFDVSGRARCLHVIERDIVSGQFVVLLLEGAGPSDHPIRAWESWLIRVFWIHEIEGSNPSALTIMAPRFISNRGHVLNERCAILHWRYGTVQGGPEAVGFPPH